MKKLIIALYIISILYGLSMLSSISLNYQNEIADQSQSYIFGSLIGVFVLTTTPLGVTMAYHGYSNKIQKEKQNAVH